MLGIQALRLAKVIGFFMLTAMMFVTPHFVEHLLKAAVSCHSDVAICKGTTFTNESDFIADERDQVESVKPEEAVVELFSEKKKSEYCCLGENSNCRFMEISFIPRRSEL
ncbi:hypothetical protein OZX74_01595 [Bifidobacterium sp. ESL0798]|uniref:hypothetical protein n=1 Tax=Bifidobacterium sp. ESL0798 TaxID=2983235 RepID=UPI0023F85BC5|nr:hypothetical protein [Bifidobacterium sp. ESL0798]WEV74279.1 hypothetical protein OZX74_01595 [Bifidobacterium sp. ESL0798]